MTRIIELVTRLNIGGPAHQVHLLATGLDRRRYHTLIVTGRAAPEEGDLTAEFKRVAHVIVIPELTRPISPWRDLVAWWRLLVICVRFQPHIIHTHMAKAGALGRMAGWCVNLLQRWRRGSQAKLIHTFHGHVFSGYFSPLAERWFVWCERWLAKGSARLIAINREVQQMLETRQIARPHQIALIPLGLCGDYLLSLAPRESSSVNGHEPGDRPWHLGIIGRVVPIKRHDVLLEGLAQLRQLAPQLAWKLLVVGDGILRPQVQQLAVGLGVSERVEFCGWQLQLGDIYSRLDAVCLTSQNEGTPVALIEALAARRPVVATDVGGVGELLGGSCPAERPFALGERGIVVRAGDAPALAKALVWAWEHPGELARTAEAGHQYVRRVFSAKRLLQDHDTLYQQLMTAEG